MGLLHKGLKNMCIKVRKLWQASGIGVRPVPQETRVISLT